MVVIAPQMTARMIEREQKPRAGTTEVTVDNQAAAGSSTATRGRCVATWFTAVRA